MATERADAERRCSSCGEPLAGKDLYEGKCAACREAEALGASGGRRGPMVRCIACGAENPPGEGFCSECGASLVPPARKLWPWAVLGCAVVGAAVCVFLQLPGRTSTARPRPPGRPARPARGVLTAVARPRVESHKVASSAAVPALDEARVLEESQEVLTLLARGDYDRAIDNYLQADEKDFARAGQALAAITSGDASPGFLRWSARLVREGRSRVAAALRRLGDPDPAWSVAFLARLAQSPEVSGAHRPLEDRTRAAIKWHLEALFGGLREGLAELGEVARAPGGRFVVAVRRGEERMPRWLRSEPNGLVWEKQAVGWVLKLSLADRLERLRETLRTSQSASAQPSSEGGERR